MKCSPGAGTGPEGGPPANLPWGLPGVPWALVARPFLPRGPPTPACITLVVAAQDTPQGRRHGSPPRGPAYSLAYRGPPSPSLVSWGPWARALVLGWGWGWGL